jgi:hypothetical protein
MNNLQRKKKSIGSKDVGANTKFAKQLHLFITVKCTFTHNLVKTQMDNI